MSLRDVCVFTAPFFASLTTMVAYLFGTEVNGSRRTGLVAAALISIVPGYISRSVAGSFDNEGVAIFALLLAFYLFVKVCLAALVFVHVAFGWGGAHARGQCRPGPSQSTQMLWPHARTSNRRAAQAINTGSIAWSAAAALGYFYMVSTWGGYIFIINLLPVYVFTLLACGRYTDRLYISCATRHYPCTH